MDTPSAPDQINTIATPESAADTKAMIVSATTTDPLSTPATGPTPDTKPPSSHAASFPIVGIGASAGGLAAFEAFFSGMPADTDPGMAFVLVQHLDPNHKSMLSELIRRQTRMQVFEVEDGMAGRINCAYIIPPNRDMAFLNGALELLEPAAPRGQRLPIDFFFRSLAQDQQERAIGIVLSGTGSDGTLGLRAIKAEGGMVIAQSIASAEFEGMPRSAIATGLVDYELAPAEMPARLIAYTQHAFGKSRQPASVAAPKTESAMKKVFVLLRDQTGHDFSQYKPSTIHRRIERRMAVQQIATLDAYIKYMQLTPTEVQTLFRDLLIGVTNFFRDPEAFLALETLGIPKLFAQHPAGRPIRVWVAGCSTGEEAYSIAILLQERVTALAQNTALMVFATDIDSRAIAAARLGVYPVGIAADMTPQRLARFFTTEPDGSFRIHKSIRDTVIFSEQDVIKDPPFSKIDLISCRNLLIYFGAELQKKLIPLFHYALNPDGMLFLGTSEGVGEFEALFGALDRKAKLYRRKADFLGAQWPNLAPFVPHLTAVASQPVIGGAKTALSKKPTLRELTEQALLQHLAPTAALVNEQGDILYLHGRTGMFLELAPGEMGVNNILRMAREGLRPALGAALQQAVSKRESVSCPGLNVKTNGHFTMVDLKVHPVKTGVATAFEAALYLVVLAQTAQADGKSVERASSGASASDPDGAIDERIIALEQELRAKDEYLQSTREELESANEELKSSNEEMQSVNEELQSTNEEMETSKEELQSVNEELATVNTELQSKVLDLSRINNDMNNLLAGTGIGTVFVDHQLRILRFTPTVRQIIHLIPSDVGRPVGHIVANLLAYERLSTDVQAVLDTLISKELELQTTEGKWYKMRIQPYRTLDNVIEGAVISFIDITEMVTAREALQKANALLRLAVVVRDAYDAITMQDLEGRILAWNPAAVRMYGWSETEALRMNARDRVPADLQAQSLALLSQLSQPGQADIVRPYSHNTQRITKAGTVMDVAVTSTALINEAGQVYAMATTERAINMANADNASNGAQS